MHEMNEKLHSSHVGYTTKEALLQIRDDINAILLEYKKKRIRTKTSRIKEVTSVSANNIVISGVTYCVTSLFGLILILKCFADPNRTDYSLIVQALLLWLFIVINVIIALQEDHLREQEIPNRVQHAIASIEQTAEHALWKETYYPHLCAPFSPCVTLQWTYRDGMIVNLPWALLVRGDIIILRPGQEVPGRCESLEPGGPAFLGGQVFQYQNHVKETFTKPRCRSPHKNKMYRMIETPYLKNLTMALEQATSRPDTVFNKKLNMCTMKLMERKMLPIAILAVLIINFLRYFCLPSSSHWTDVYIEQVVASTLPLLQLVFPLAWITLNCYGMAKFKQIAETSMRIERTKSCSISEETEDPLLTVLSETNINVGHIKSLWTKFYLIMTGKENMVTRTSNIIHVLGSLTALCCVDKKGILSWPNPTAEKVFFLRNSGPLSKSSSKTSFVGSVGHLSQCQEPDQTSDWNKPTSDIKNCSLEPTTIAEVLDLTHDQNAAFRVEFDDQAWHEHLARLKPLGLAALLNTCAPSARRKYFEFCAHLTCEAQLSEDLVPVTNRRCLCELAKQIGFTESATQIYNLQENIATFRHLQADTIRRETRFARSLHLNTRVKVPLPHMLGVIVKDPARQLQLLCQGTADIVLDSCIDFWNGNDLSPISPSDRKKILDFYQRSSLTAYCTAFSYKPLTHGITRECANNYLELPADSRQLYAAQPDSWNEPREPLGGHFHSTDSLLCTDTHEEDITDADGFFELQCNQVFIGMVTMQYQAQSDMVELIERLERACVRFVHFSKENELRSRVFSEKMGLESGWNCHISLASDTQSKPASPTTSQNIKTPCKENVWQNDADFFNTSVVSNVNREMSNPDNLGNSFLINSSKLSKTKILSLSAPGAINLEHSTVKFENEVKLARHSITTHNSGKTETVLDPSLSEDSLLGAWEQSNDQQDSPPEGCRSLSCLTDSTEHSAPVNFDMSNRAKLPRGIENIRPHIEQVDNVPLLVSLFTDCTASSARTMLSLMQDYGEVVAVMGSAANNHNMEIFLQADASVAVEPLYPVLCQKIPPYQVPADCAGPIDLARSLNSIPCSLSMTRDADVSLFMLVSMSRHYMICLWNGIQFWMYALCAISFLQIFALAGGLPLALPTGLTMWLSFVIVSAISVSLVFAPLDQSIMHRAVTKHQTTVDLQTVLFAICYYCCKFIPTMILIVVEYGLTMRSFCEQIAAAEEDISCAWVYPVRSLKSTNGSFTDTLGVTQEWLGWRGTFSDGYYLSQHICLALITVHLVVISISFVHRDSSIWQKYFWTNIIWCITVMAIAIMQSVLSFILLGFVYSNTRGEVSWLKYTVPWPISILYVMSPIAIFILNEFIKWLEIKTNSRYQRRARLDFGTKLGMNSPF